MHHAYSSDFYLYLESTKALKLGLMEMGRRSLKAIFDVILTVSSLHSSSWGVYVGGWVLEECEMQIFIQFLQKATNSKPSQGGIQWRLLGHTLWPPPDLDPCIKCLSVKSLFLIQNSFLIFETCNN